MPKVILVTSYNYLKMRDLSRILLENYRSYPLLCMLRFIFSMITH